MTNVAKGVLRMGYSTPTADQAWEIARTAGDPEPYRSVAAAIVAERAWRNVALDGSMSTNAR
jgi:hypothetical protein